MRKNIRCAIIVAFIFSLCFAACQPTPDKPIVVGKDQDAMLEQAAGTPSPESSAVLDGAEPAATMEPVLLREQLNVPEGRYTFEDSGADDRLTITVDAEIQVPERESMPITRVERGSFAESFIAGVVYYFFGDTPVYDVTESSTAEAAPFAGTMHTVALPGLSGKFYRLGIQDWSPSIDNPIIDGERCWLDVRIPATEDALKEDGDVWISFSRRIYEEGTGSPNYGNCGIAYTYNKDDQEKTFSGLEITLEEAETLCDGFFEALGLSGEYRLGIASVADAGADKDNRYAYKLYYSRHVGGIATFTNNNWLLGHRITEESTWSLPWGYEMICFDVNDFGIVELEWYHPYTVLDTVTERTNMLPFSEIRDTFERMVKIEYEATTKLYGGEMAVDVHDVQLSLVRIREQNAQNATGLLVPAWVFYGNTTTKDSEGHIGYGRRAGGGSSSTVMGTPFPILIVNAIDGSIIDLAQGY